MTAKAQVVVTSIPLLTSDPPFITQSISLFGHAWPVAGLAAAVIVNSVWMALSDTAFPS